MKTTKNSLKVIGDVLGTDDRGFLVKLVSKDTFYKPLVPLIGKVVTVAKDVFTDELHSVYIRGSVAKGTFIPNISDIDPVFITKNTPSDELFEQFKKRIIDLNKKYPDVTNIEKNVQTIDEVLKAKSPIYKYQSVCVYGKDLMAELPDMKPGKQTVVHLKKILGSIDESIPRIGEETEARWIRHWSIWMCKQLIRSCHELLAEDLQQFARDIYPCYKASADAWPEQEPMLRRVAEIAVFGTEDKSELIDITKQMKKFLEPKIKVFNDQQTSSHATINR